MARIPRSQRLSRKRRAEAIGPQTPEGEAFRILRANLRYFNVDDGLHSILIVSPEQGDGKSTVAAALAMTMAEMGDDVVLVEADLRKGSELPRRHRQPGRRPLRRAHRDAARAGPDRGPGPGRARRSGRAR